VHATASATALLVLATVLSACAPENGAAVQSAARVLSDGRDGTPRRVEVRHAGGVTVVEGVPERVVALTPLTIENVVALGVEPAAVTAFARPTASQGYREYPPYLARRLEGRPIVGTRAEPNVEAILETRPELILGVDEHLQSFETLSRAGPTILFGQTGDWTRKDRQPWRTCLRTLGVVLDRESAAEDRLAAYDRAVARGREAIRSAIGDETVLLVRTLAKGMRVHGHAHGTMGHVLYGDLGLRAPEGLREDWADQYVPMELLVELDPDHVFFIKGNPQLTRSLVTGPFWSRLAAVQAGHVYEVDLYWIRGHGWYGKMAIVEDAVRHLAGG
jgi:iron complex transport system substrate-binding protein